MTQQPRKSKKITVSLSDKVVEMIEELSKNMGMSKSAIMALAVNKLMETQRYGAKKTE